MAFRAIVRPAFRATLDSDLARFMSSQQAIAAARTAGEWRVAGHGLMQDRAAEWTADVLRFRVCPQAKPGVFGAVADILGSGQCTTPRPPHWSASQ